MTDELQEGSCPAFPDADDDGPWEVLGDVGGPGARRGRVVQRSARGGQEHEVHTPQEEDQQSPGDHLVSGRQLQHPSPHYILFFHLHLPTQ